MSSVSDTRRLPAIRSGAHTRLLFSALFLSVIGSVTASAQVIAQPATPAAPKDVPNDVFGRTSPRDTVLGFLRASRNGNYEAAAQYLNTKLQGKPAERLAEELFAVIDRRLPARLNKISDQPEGSLAFLTRPNEELIGTITNADGHEVNILVERVAREKIGMIWLFSGKTLAAIPELATEVELPSMENLLPAWLAQERILSIPLYEYFALIVGLPLLYLLTGLPARLFRRSLGSLIRRIRKKPGLPDPDLGFMPARLLTIALVIRWALSKVSLSLLERQLWFGIAATFTIAGCTWILIRLAGLGQRFLGSWMERFNTGGAGSILLLGRRMLDFLFVFAGVLVALRHFGVNLTAALAGLGVGGIAVALAAQKTLENVIGGISIIFDQAVRIGDTLKAGDTFGEVEHIGLRSTRIRTLGRTLVSVPNGHLANVQLENFTAREKFWFQHNVRLRYETTAHVVRSVLDGISTLLRQHSLVEVDSVRVRLLGLGASSMEIEIFAYVIARDGWAHFLAIQEEMLLQILETIETAGAHLALPSQTLYLGKDTAFERATVNGGQGSTLNPESQRASGAQARPSTSTSSPD
jgi:MscS family membrane protein